MSQAKKTVPEKRYEVEVNPVDSEQLSDVISKNCFFCHKMVKSKPEGFHFIQRLTGTKFYCSFCIRHNFHYRTNRNILLTSFRGIIGYYYYKHYLDRYSQKKLWFSDIDLFINRHVEIGNCNPVFCYDPTTYMWFIDFNRVGSSGKKMPYETVEGTMHEMLKCFHVDKNITQYAQTQLWEKFKDALKLYYEKRQRPKDRRVLVPTLQGCSHGHNDEDLYERTRGFLNKHFLLV